MKKVEEKETRKRDLVRLIDGIGVNRYEPGSTQDKLVQAVAQKGSMLWLNKQTYLEFAEAAGRNADKAYRMAKKRMKDALHADGRGDYVPEIQFWKSLKKTTKA